MKLATFLADRGISDDAFARDAQLSRTQVSRIRRGLAIPSPDKMRNIFVATGGLVSANDFYGIGDGV